MFDNGGAVQMKILIPEPVAQAGKDYLLEEGTKGFV
jgi:hypothetical protein